MQQLYQTRGKCNQQRMLLAATSFIRITNDLTTSILQIKMPILTCKYCQSKCLDRDVMIIYDDPDEANWFTSHYAQCEGIPKKLKCGCGDLQQRCNCRSCKSCIKTPNYECDSSVHPKRNSSVDRIRTREGLNDSVDSKEYLESRAKILRLRHIDPLKNIVRTSKPSIG